MCVGKGVGEQKRLVSLSTITVEAVGVSEVEEAVETTSIAVSIRCAITHPTIRSRCVCDS